MSRKSKKRAKGNSGVGVNSINASMSKLCADQCDDLLPAARGLIEEQIKSGVSSLTPVLFISGLKRESIGADERSIEVYTKVCVLNVDFNTDLEKQIALRECARFCVREGLMPIAACLASEAWTVHLGPDEKLGEMQVSDRQDRRESACVFVQSVDMRCNKISSCILSRDSDGRIDFARDVGGNADWSTGDSSRSPLLTKFWRAVAIANDLRPGEAHV